MAPAWLEGLVVPFAYEGPVREAITRVKYRNERAALGWLADSMTVAVRAAWAGGGAVRPVVVTWVPATGPRRRARGFDHARLLARRVGAGLGLPCRPLLARLDTRVQTGRDGRARRAAPPRFVARPWPPAAGPGGVLLVDDVVTTGTTLSAAALAGRAAGWPAVVAAVAARRG